MCCHRNVTCSLGSSLGHLASVKSQWNNNNFFRSISFFLRKSNSLPTIYEGLDGGLICLMILTTDFRPQILLVTDFSSDLGKVTTGYKWLKYLLSTHFFFNFTGD